MGNLLSAHPATAPGAPPPLIVACISSDYEKYLGIYSDLTSSLPPNSPNPLTTFDSQGNSVLHALFSSQNPSLQILSHIHTSLPSQTLSSMYSQKSTVLGCNPIWICVAYGNLSILNSVGSKIGSSKLLELINVPNLQGDTSLLATCSKGNLKMIEYLSTLYSPSQFSDLLLKPNKNGTTALWIVIGNSHCNVLSYLLTVKDLELDLNAPNDNGLYPLHVCCERGDIDTLRILLDNVSSIDVRDKNGANPLHVAAFCGNVKVVEVLVESVKPEVLKLKDSAGRSAYVLAMLKDCTEIGELLKSKGAGKVTNDEVKEIEEAKERREENKRKREEERNNAKGLPGVQEIS